MPSIRDNAMFMPSLDLRVFCVEQAQASQGAYLQPRVQNVTDRFLLPTQQQQWLVPLESTQILCVGTVYPTQERQYRVSEIQGGSLVLQQHSYTLDSSLSNLVFLAPAVQIVVNFVKTDTQAQVPPEKQPDKQQSGQRRAGKFPDTAHMFTASMPLSELFSNLLQSGTHVHTAVTSEDGMRQWQLHVSMADAAKLSPAAAQQRKQQLASQLEAVQLHTAWVQKNYGFCETVQQSMSFVSNCRVKRKQAAAAVMQKLTGQPMVASWELQMSRNLNTVVTAEGTQEPAGVDNQQIGYMREGAQHNGQLQQTMCMFVNSLIGSIVSNAQHAGVQISYNTDTQSAVFDALAVHKANHDFVTAKGADALMHKVMYQCQQIVCGRTQYGSDPAYSTCMRVDATNLDVNGRGQLQVTPVVQLLPTSGEDQKVEIGWGPLETSRPFFDCEDSANTIACMASVMRACPDVTSFVQSVCSTISLFPFEVQPMTSTILDMSAILWQNEAKANTKIVSGSNNVVAFEQLDKAALLNAVQKAHAEPGMRLTSACSVLAQAPQIGNMQTGATRNSMLVDMNTSSETFLRWWGDKSSGLNGHSVCASLECKPVLKTQVNGLPVHITLLGSDIRLYEGTGVAIQRELPCTQQATLKLGSGSQQRIMLQQMLDSGIVISSCMAASIKSALHTSELKEHLQTVVNACKDLDMPIVSPVQSYSLHGVPQNANQRQVMIQGMFYAVCLSCELGGVLSLDTSCVNEQQACVQGSQQPSLLLPGAPLVNGLLPERVVRVVTSSPSTPEEIQRLRALGAFLSLNVLDAETYLQHVSASLTPLHLRQTMTICPVRNCLVPLSAQQLQNMANFTCGIFCSSPLLKAPKGTYKSTQEVEANMQTLLSNTANIVGSLPVVTAAGFSDNMTIAYAS